MKIVHAFLIVGVLASPTAAQTSAGAGQQPVRPPAGTGSAAGDERRTVPAPTGTSGMAVSPDYRLTAGDKLRIEVYREPQLSQSVEIRPDGKVTLPLVGDVQAAGTTARELSTALTERFREYVTTPVVTVMVAEATTPMIYVMGEVRTPGSQPVRGQITALQALAVAGGFTEFANTKKIRILRRGPNGTTETIKFNYKEALAHPEHPLVLQPGDTVIVP